MLPVGISGLQAGEDVKNEELVTVLLNGQIQLQQTVSELAKTLQGYAELEDRRSERLTQADERLGQAQEKLNASVERFIASSNARIERLEANLDAFIRIITAEHGNGTKKG
jgi:exonuclease VII large subunit